jgi:hypothetical protein
MTPVRTCWFPARQAATFVATAMAIALVTPTRMAGQAAAPAPTAAPAPIKAAVPPAAKPAWTKGIQPLSRESYYHAIECGKLGEAQSPCVFYDANLCKNDDYTLSMYSPYKQVAYEVWVAASRKQEPPTPSYQGAQRTKVVLGVTPVRGAKNPLAKVVVKRGGRTIAPDTSTLDSGGGNFIFDFPAFSPTATITLELAGKVRTQSCVLSPAVLSRLR